MLGKHQDLVISRQDHASLPLARGQRRYRQDYGRHNVTMVRAVIHEMRSPLTVIRAYSSAVLARKVRLNIRETRDVIRRIEASARLLEVILEDLETLTELGNLRLHPTNVEIASFVSEIATDLQALIPGRQLEVMAQPLRVQTDPDRLKQVMHNLVQNAHKYSRPSGKIVVQVERSKQEGRISVQDEGPGVPPEEMDHIFEPYYRGGGSEGRTGRGLGLAISKRLIEAQGGKLQAARMPEGRFQFFIALPMAS